MKKLLLEFKHPYVLLFFLVFVSIPNYSWSSSNTFLDSLVQKVIDYPIQNGTPIDYQESMVYSKFLIRTNCKNISRKFIQLKFKINKGRNLYIGENLSQYVFNKENVESKNLASYSTCPSFKDISVIMKEYSNIFLFNERLSTNGALSPFHRKNLHLYKFQLDTSYIDNSHTIYRIKIEPKYLNSQLISGFFTCEKNGRVKTFSFVRTHNLFLKIYVNGTLGENLAESSLVKQIGLNILYNFVDNKIFIQSKSIVNILNRENINQTKGKRLFRKKDKGPKTIRNLIFFTYHRPIPLLEIEDSLYRLNSFPSISRQDTSASSHIPNKENSNVNSDLDFDFVEKTFFRSFKFSVGKNKMQIPALITPSLFQWSQSKGLAIQTQLKMNHQTGKGITLSISPRLGYNFKQNQFYWRIPIKYYFLPKLNGGIRFSIGNGNRIYNSKQAEEIRSALKGIEHYDSLMQVLKDYHFFYYKDFSSQIHFDLEPQQGLKLTTGIIYHRRTQINPKEEIFDNNYKKKYESLASSSSISWTPMKREKKGAKESIFVYPTLSILYERGFRLLGCQNNYERWEFDLQHNWSLNTIYDLYSRFSFGFYTKQKEMYFVDYSNFHYQSLPNGTTNDLMGQFQLLDKRWYNESDYYIMFCSALNSPMLLISKNRFFSKLVKTEQVYFNSLMVTALKPYIEIGYGICFPVLDVSFFSGFANKSGLSFGVKVGFSFLDKL